MARDVKVSFVLEARFPFRILNVIVESSRGPNVHRDRLRVRTHGELHGGIILRYYITRALIPEKAKIGIKDRQMDREEARGTARRRRNVS